MKPSQMPNEGLRSAPLPSELRRGSVGRREALRSSLESRRDVVETGRTAYMRRAGKPSTFTRRLGAAAPPDLYTIAINRMGYGEINGQRAEWIALGGNETQRFEAYVDEQVYPNSIVDTEYEQKVGAAGFTTLNKNLSQLWIDHHVNGSGWSQRSRPIRESELDQFMRAIYSKKQLQEAMVEFWLSHFNMYGWDYWSVHVWPDVINVIRTNCFNNFHTLLRKITQHTSMLYYLDNYASTRSGPNENHARELVELHTMGAENYYGVGDPLSVPRDANNIPIAYVDNDVYEATRALTGWSVNNGWSGRLNNGSFYYDDADHDRFQKNFLGRVLPPDSGQQDGEDVLRYLADHPGTGRYIARKLCQRFISDDPPQSIVDEAAAKFNQLNTSASQIRETLRVILKSDEFKNTWNEKIKRPFDVVVSALRATRANFRWEWNADDVDDFFWNYDRCGQALFTWPTPDGLPDERGKWQSTTPRVMTWRLMLWMSDERNGSGSHRWDVVAKTPSGVNTAEEIVDYWVDRVLGRALDPADRDEMVDFMRAGFGSSSPLPIGSDSDTDARVRSLVALICNCPNFLER